MIQFVLAGETVRGLGWVGTGVDEDVMEVSDDVGLVVGKLGCGDRGSEAMILVCSRYFSLFLVIPYYFSDFSLFLIIFYYFLCPEAPILVCSA